MCVNRVPKNGNYTILDNLFIYDQNLSYKEVGILVYCLSRPNDWVFSIKEIASHSRDGIDAVRTGIANLVKFGYAKKVKKRDANGQYTRESWDFNERPALDLPCMDNPHMDKPSMDNPELENPTQENPTLLNTDILNTESIEREERARVKSDFPKANRVPLSSSQNPLPKKSTPQLRSTPLQDASYSVDGQPVEDIVAYFKDKYNLLHHRLSDRCEGDIGRDKALAAFAEDRLQKSWKDDNHLRADINRFIDHFKFDKHETAKRSGSTAACKGNAWQTEEEYWSKRNRQAKPRGIRAINGSAG
ncbi:hypothetical protein V6R21_11605 [Limibacter armeniacum]|uniref:hypothetical protein n=1 Tax=Limibacter armeniacum TaxID=466084 RepID=UPI002FE6992B